MERMSLSVIRLRKRDGAGQFLGNRFIFFRSMCQWRYAEVVRVVHGRGAADGTHSRYSKVTA